MIPAVHFTESLWVDVRVKLGGRDLGVAKQLLNQPNISTAGKHMCSEAMT